MENKIVKHKLSYVEKGQIKEIEIKIVLISRYVQDLYIEWISLSQEYKNGLIELIEMQNDLYSIKNKREGEWKKEYKEKKEEVNKYEDTLKSIGEKALGIRHKTVSTILSDNGVEDELLLSYDFWDKKTNPNEVIEFLSSVIYKDAKKKAL